MEKTGLILEGGGYRGLYTSGVLDYLMEHDIYIPEVYGVSAGACNAISYAAKQPGRSATFNFEFCKDKRCNSCANLIKVRGLFDMQFIFEEIPRTAIPFHYDTFFHSEVNVHIGATNMLTGNCDFFTREQMDWRMFPVRASCAIPLVSHIYYLNNTPYMDGGIAAPIPLRQSLNAGNNKHLIVLTQDPDYQKKISPSLSVIRRVYKKYPNFINTISRRHIVYNRQRKICRIMERTGQAIVLQPQDPVKVRNIRADVDSLKELYRIGYHDAQKNIERIRAFLDL